MTAWIILIALLLLAAIALAYLLRGASNARRGEFDGGFNHENETRITRVRGTYIINDDRGE